MTTSTQWQLARESAERYQTILTPSILGPFAQALVDFAALQPGESVVDVGCGTGAAARYAAEVVGPSGNVVGIDINESMIEVAQSLPAAGGNTLEWRVANATQLPLSDQSVDVVLCAQTVQFLPQKQASLVEMKRVVKQNGRIALSLWCVLEENPYFEALVTAVARHINPETAAGLKSAFSLSDAAEIQSLLQEAGCTHLQMAKRQLDLPLPELTGFIPRHISATPMSIGYNQATPAVQQAIVDDVVEQVGRYGGNGRVQIPFRSHMILIQNYP